MIDDIKRWINDKLSSKARHTHTSEDSKMIEDIKQRLIDGEALVPLEVNALLAHERDAYTAQISDMRVQLAKRKNKEPISENGMFAAIVISAVIGTVSLIAAFILSPSSPSPSIEESLLERVLDAKSPRYGEQEPHECGAQSVLQSLVEQVDEVCQQWEDAHP